LASKYPVEKCNEKKRDSKAQKTKESELLENVAAPENSRLVP